MPNGNGYYSTPTSGQSRAPSEEHHAPLSHSSHSARPNHREDTLIHSNSPSTSRNVRIQHHRTRDDDDDNTAPINSHSLIRRGPSFEKFNPPSSPTFRVTLKPNTTHHNGFRFPPLTFDLYDGGPSAVVCRSEKQSGHAAVYQKGKIKLGSRVITRKSHAQIWCEDNKVCGCCV